LSLSKPSRERLSSDDGRLPQAQPHAHRRSRRSRCSCAYCPDIEVVPDSRRSRDAAQPDVARAAPALARALGPAPRRRFGRHERGSFVFPGRGATRCRPGGGTALGRPGRDGSSRRRPCGPRSARTGAAAGRLRSGTVRFRRYIGVHRGPRAEPPGTGRSREAPPSAALADSRRPGPCRSSRPCSSFSPASPPCPAQSPGHGFARNSPPGPRLRCWSVDDWSPWQ